jgi:isocitrate dehydrogenase
VHNAWLKTMEDGVHTYDIFKDGVSRQKVGTREFADAVCARMGQKPATLKAVSYGQGGAQSATSAAPPRVAAKKELVGVDVFLDRLGATPAQIAASMKPLGGEFDLALISNRGVKVWPDGPPEAFCSDHWRCRFTGRAGAKVAHEQIVRLLERVAGAGIDFIQVQNLYNFDGQAGYSAVYGE